MSGSPRRLWLFTALGSMLAMVQCSADGECTELDCDNQAVVTFPAGLVSGAYDLIIASEGRMIGARCLDPSAPETGDNPPGLTCDANGYELIDDSLANSRSVMVTIIDVDSGDPLVEQSEVILNAVGEEQPNGPDCPPTCYIRNGRLLP